MQNSIKMLFLLLAGLSLVACSGGVKDKDGNRLVQGRQYVMTEAGLEPLQFPKDNAGNRLEPGKTYVMTPDGLELMPFLKDRAGNKVEVGHDYTLAEDGLQMVNRRDIRGVVRDHAGKPVRGVVVTIANTDHVAMVGAGGEFSLPFTEGFTLLNFEFQDLPQWCKPEGKVSETLSRVHYPKGWDVGTISLPCSMADGAGAAWATADGTFIDNGDGTVSDVKNHVMWEANSNDARMPWVDAVAYAEHLSLANHSDWRLPSPDELKALHASGAACSWGRVPMIETAPTVWTSEQLDPASATVVNVCSGKGRRSVLNEQGSENPGVLAVRNLK
jgi:hypothetical protein